MLFPFTVLTPPFEYDVVHVQGYRCPLLSFFIGLGQGSMFLTYNEKNNSALRTVIKTLLSAEVRFQAGSIIFNAYKSKYLKGGVYHDEYGEKLFYLQKSHRVFMGAFSGAYSGDT